MIFYFLNFWILIDTWNLFCFNSTAWIFHFLSKFSLRKIVYFRFGMFGIVDVKNPQNNSLSFVFLRSSTYFWQPIDSLIDFLNTLCWLFTFSFWCHFDRCHNFKRDEFIVNFFVGFKMAWFCRFGLCHIRVLKFFDYYLIFLKNWIKICLNFCRFCLPHSIPLIRLSSVGVGCVAKMTEKINGLGGKENDSK